jgi:8-oxo-dGTP pyrophosphatase MutT (NUDIX family)
LTPPADGGGRPSAVLILFGDGVAASEHSGDGGVVGEHSADGHVDERSGPDLLLIQRSDDLRLHAGQPAFPGGAIDADDSGPVAAALREAVEETGLDPEGVVVVGVLPELFIPRTKFRVVPVLAWWRRPSAVAPVDVGEVAAVERIRVSELADPAVRVMVRNPGGYASPAFRVRGMLIWGFTALLIDRLLALGGWEVPWDHSVVVDLPSRPG